MKTRRPGATWVTPRTRPVRLVQPCSCSARGRPSLKPQQIKSTVSESALEREREREPRTFLRSPSDPAALVWLSAFASVDQVQSVPSTSVLPTHHLSERVDSRNSLFVYSRLPKVEAPQIVPLSTSREEAAQIPQYVSPLEPTSWNVERRRAAPNRIVAVLKTEHHFIVSTVKR
jgi:hypothetical protein